MLVPNFLGGACVTGFETLRSIGYVAISTKPPVWVATNNYIYPTNPSETQNMDSRVSGTTTGTHTVLLSQIGRWKFDYWSNNNPTNCSIQPTQSPVKTMSVNVLDCAPAWWTIPPTNKTLHAPLGTIYVHIPPSMWSDLQAAVSAAVADWNAALAGTGVSLQVVDHDCGEGGNCVNFFEGGEFGPDDGCAAAHPGSSGPDGAFTSPPGISLPNLPATKNWRLRPFDRLRRSVAHELDHILGSNHTGSPCTNATSIMTPLSVVSLTDCNTATADPMNPSPTPNDTLPVGSSTYGNQLQKWCNF